MESDLSCGGDQQTEAFYGDVDSDAHACKAQVTLPHDGQERFVQRLRHKQYKSTRERDAFSTKHTIEMQQVAE